MIKKYVQDLVIGKRYWLDGVKDISAEYAGVERSSVCFINPDPEDGQCYKLRETIYGEAITFANTGGLTFIEAAL